MWTNAPALDLEELVSRVGYPTDTCSEDAELYNREGVISPSVSSGEPARVTLKRRPRVQMVGGQRSSSAYLTLSCFTL